MTKSADASRLAVRQLLAKEAPPKTDLFGLMDLLEPFFRMREQGSWEFLPSARLSEQAVRDSIPGVVTIVPVCLSENCSTAIAKGARLVDGDVTWIYQEIDRPWGASLDQKLFERLADTCLEHIYPQVLDNAFQQSLIGTQFERSFTAVTGIVDIWDGTAPCIYAAARTAVFWMLYCLLGGAQGDALKRCKLISLLPNFIPFGRSQSDSGRVFVLTA